MNRMIFWSRRLLSTNIVLLIPKRMIIWIRVIDEYKTSYLSFCRIITNLCGLVQSSWNITLLYWSVLVDLINLLVLFLLTFDRRDQNESFDQVLKTHFERFPLNSIWYDIDNYFDINPDFTNSFRHIIVVQD